MGQDCNYQLDQPPVITLKYCEMQTTHSFIPPLIHQFVLIKYNTVHFTILYCVSLHCTCFDTVFTVPVKCLEDSDAVLHQMSWPPQSPNLNPIEMILVDLDRRVKEKQPTSAQHMWELLQDCWKNIPGEAG